MSTKTVNQQWFEATDLQVGWKVHSPTLDSETKPSKKPEVATKENGSPGKRHNFSQTNKQEILPLAF